MLSGKLVLGSVATLSVYAVGAPLWAFSSCGAAFLIWGFAFRDVAADYAAFKGASTKMAEMSSKVGTNIKSK